MLSPEELSGLYLSAKVASVATLFCLPFAICLGWMLARYEFRSKFLLEAMLQLPMVLPPVVLGYVLLVLFSPQGWIGQVLAHWGIELAFNWKGAVLAAMLVAFPLLVQMLNPQLEQVAASLGAAPLKVFFSISLPLVLPGILMGSILGFSRSLGEFGATITFVGNIPDETRTIPIAIYTLIQQPDGEAAAMRLVLLSTGLAFAALLANYFILHRYQRKLGQN
ncbi:MULTISPECIES: molybdate ABC transporter permease subunit [Acinetobacter]|uniref:molybdate ABC transporter permease subunit n=1 Tax=Acinetobacter TaxID=469 RepID=UPI00144469F1|nr:molybdate ABC transporter permease subunit [Acinetobacter indicus]